MAREERRAMRHGSTLGDNLETPHTLARRGFVQAVLAVAGSLILVGMAWLVSRRAPSAGRNPEFTPPAVAPTRPAPTATPAAVAD